MIRKRYIRRFITSLAINNFHQKILTEPYCIGIASRCIGITGRCINIASRCIGITGRCINIASRCIGIAGRCIGITGQDVGQL
ncbi:hypothetical protein [Nostoc sp.]|uniref:hypothetical protein n=1 Tax=Nostoc sp. TaxID=1180 RepID=UPI002FF7C831